MADAQILIKYDGGDALRHSIDARLFGQSLQGLDKMVSDCLLIISHERLPKRGERAPLILKVHEPQRGSYEIPALYQELSQVLAMGMPIVQAIGPEVLKHYVEAVLEHFKGNDSAVELAIERMADMHKASLDALLQSQREAHQVIDRSDERRHLEHMEMMQVLRASIMSSGPAAVDYVAPVGRSVDTVSFSSGVARTVDVTVDDAERIRDSQKLDWRPVAEETFRTDGFKFHSNGLSIENPEREGFLMAEVNDPVFDEESNPYTLAAQKRGQIRVLARMGYKNGKLARIQILDFIKEV